MPPWQVLKTSGPYSGAFCAPSGACARAELTIGDEPWSKDAESWLKEWVWTPSHDRGETLLFFDAASGALVGFITWRIRKEHIHEGDPKRKAIQIHFMGIAADYQGARSSLGCSVATAIFERALDRGEAVGGQLPALIDVEEPNAHARAVYRHWLFERRNRPSRRSRTGRVYLDLWRPPRET